MKKSLLFVLLLLSIKVNSQNVKYLLNEKVLTHRFLGTQADLRLIISQYGLDSTQCVFTPPPAYSCILGGSLCLYKNDYLEYFTHQKAWYGEPDSIEFYNNFGDSLRNWDKAKILYSTTSQANALYPLQSLTLSINGTSQSLASNRSWTGIGVELPSMSGQSGKILSNNGSSASWITSNGYTAGTGISIASNVITNSAPDQTVSVTVNTGLNTTGASYPNMVVKLDDPSGGNVTRSFVTTTSSTGFQPSSTNGMWVTYSIYTQASSLIAGNNSADVFLETAATNSTTPSDWTTKGQTGSSVVGIISVCAGTATVSCWVPKTYYVRLRSLATGANSANAVFTYKYGTETTYK